MTIFIIIVSITGIAIATNQFLYAISDSKQRKDMNRREEILRNAGVTPYGSTLSHGMCINQRTGELVADQKQSTVWYKRLV